MPGPPAPWVLRHSRYVLLVGGATATTAFCLTFVLAGPADFSERLDSGLRAATALAALTAGLLAWARLELSTIEHGLQVSRDGTERYGRAVEQVGSESEVSRVGGIFALERIAIDAVTSPDAYNVSWKAALDVIAAVARSDSQSVLRQQDQPSSISSINQSVSREQAPLTVVECLRVLGRFRTQTGHPELDLGSIDLRGVVATNVDLSGVDLRSARLDGARLAGSNLYRANFSGATLDKADLSGAFLRGAKLLGASLRDASIAQADLSGNYVPSDERSELPQPRYLDAGPPPIDDIAGADLRFAWLWGADLTGANLKFVNLQHAHLNSFHSGQDDIEGANLSGVTLFGANLHDASLNGAILVEADLRADLSNADLSDADLSRATFSQSVPSLMGYGDALLRKTRFTRAILDGVNFGILDLSEVDLSDADTSGADLRYVRRSLQQSRASGIENPETKWPSR